MGDQVGGWSSRKKTFTVGGTLGALASLVTIVSFVTAHGGTPASGPADNPSQNPAGYSPAPTAPAQPATTSSDSTVSSQYPASAQSAVVSYCQQNYGGSVPYCQCDLNWLEANVPYSMYETDPTGWAGKADAYASCQ
jgi:hypothetical protein